MVSRVREGDTSALPKASLLTDTIRMRTNLYLMPHSRNLLLLQCVQRSTHSWISDANCFFAWSNGPNPWYPSYLYNRGSGSQMLPGLQVPTSSSMGTSHRGSALFLAIPIQGYACCIRPGVLLLGVSRLIG